MSIRGESEKWIFETFSTGLQTEHGIFGNVRGESENTIFETFSTGFQTEDRIGDSKNNHHLF